MDAAIIAAKLLADKKRKPIDFGQFDFITDAVNLQKLFAFCQVCSTYRDPRMTIHAMRSLVEDDACVLPRSRGTALQKLDNTNESESAEYQKSEPSTLPYPSQ